MDFSKLQNIERYGTLDRKAWVALSDQYASLKKARRAAQLRLAKVGIFMTWLGLAAILAAGVATYFIGWGGFAIGFVVVGLIAIIGRLLYVTGQRNSYEIELAGIRAKEINRWLNEQSQSKGAP